METRWSPSAMTLYGPSFLLVIPRTTVTLQHRRDQGTGTYTLSLSPVVVKYGTDSFASLIRISLQIMYDMYVVVL